LAVLVSGQVADTIRDIKLSHVGCGQIQLDWPVPQSESEIVRYAVEFQQQDGDWGIYRACDRPGCMIPEARLAGAPFNLSKDDAVQVRLSAKNLKGWNRENKAKMHIEFGAGCSVGGAVSTESQFEEIPRKVPDPSESEDEVVLRPVTQQSLMKIKQLEKENYEL